MPNRIIKESITTSATLAKLSDAEERHFWRLLVQADDFGYLDARTEVIRARAYPMMLDKVTIRESEARTQALVAIGLLHLFDSEGKRYGHFPTWDAHQQKRAKYSKYPQVQSCAINCQHMIALAPETLDIRNETLETRHRPLWTPPEWFVPLTSLSEYKTKNHERAANGIAMACVESGADVADVIGRFANEWPTLKLKYNWHDPVATLRGQPLRIAIEKSLNGAMPNGKSRLGVTRRPKEPPIVYHTTPFVDGKPILGR